MASYSITGTSGVTGIHKTLTGTTADAITITSPSNSFRVEVLNRTAGTTIYARGDGTTAVSAADGTVAIVNGTVSTAEWRSGPGVMVLSVVGSGDAYSVHVITQDAW